MVVVVVTTLLTMPRVARDHDRVWTLCVGVVVVVAGGGGGGDTLFAI